MFSAHRPRRGAAQANAHLQQRMLLFALPLVLALPVLWWSLAAATPTRIAVGDWGDQAVLDGVHGSEQSPTEAYRWTMPASRITLPNLSGGAQVLLLRLHGWQAAGRSVPSTRLDVNGAAWGAFQTGTAMRTYQVLLPPAALDLDRAIAMHSDPYEPPGDPRTLGVALDTIELRAAHRPDLPGVAQFAGQVALLLLLALLVWLLALPLGWSVASVALGCVALVGANWQQPLWVAEALAPWLLIIGMLVALAWLALPWTVRAGAAWLAPQQVRMAWGLGTAALLLRLFGAVHPLFAPHDLLVHTGWLDDVVGGQLYLYSTPGEMRNREIFNPPGGYVLLLPLLLLLPSWQLVVQVGVALLDAVGCLLLLPLARELRLSATAGLLALALAVALPINSTMLWWGFATNALAQPLWMLLLWLLLRVIRRPSLAGIAVFAVAVGLNLLMHAGALVLLVATLGLCMACAIWWLPARSRWAVLGGGLAAVLVLVPVYFAAAAGPLLQQSGGSQSVATLDLGASLAKGWADRFLRLNYTAQGWIRGFGMPVLALLPFGLARLLNAPRRHMLQRTLVAVWIVICVLFAAAYLSLGTVARYIYFTTPLICLAAGVTLAALRRWPAGRVLVLAIVLFTAWVGVALWTGGVLLDLKPSLVPLTH